MKRLLLIGSSIPERLEDFYARSFRKLGIEVTVFDPEAAALRLDRHRILTRVTLPLRHHLVHFALLAFYKQPKWDAVFVIKGQWLAADTIDICRKRALSIPWIVLNPDSPFDAGRGTASRHVKESIPLYDIYFIWSRELLAQLHEAGARRAVYLPFAHEEELHYPAPIGAIDTALAESISFVGTYDSNRASILEGIADLPLIIFGGGWGGLPMRSPLRRRLTGQVAVGAHLRRVTTSSAACLNILRAQNYGSHNMRTFEVPAMSGVMITHRSAEQQEFFPENQASLMYHGRDELRERVREALSQGEHMTAMRRAALEHSRAHTYVERARQVLREIEAR